MALSMMLFRAICASEHLQNAVKFADRFTWRRLYDQGIRKPNYPPPAVITRCVIHSKNIPEDHPGYEFRNSIVWLEQYICPYCAEIHWDFAAVIDFDIDRCMDNLIPFAEYVHVYRIDEAAELLLEREEQFEATGGRTQ